ncbi:MAG: calcium/sodium antiporter [Saprospiraceae bacterium]|jgi:cation:H+ antiporter
MFNFIILACSLVGIIYGANFLVDGASSFAKKFKIPNIVIGLTIVAFGTSSPELAVSTYSAYTGNADISIGNVIGSNIVNILFILGVSAIIFPLTILKNTVLKEIPFSLLAAIVIYLMINDILFSGHQTDVISFADGLILLGFMTIFMYYLIHLARNSGEDENLDIKDMTISKSVLLIVSGLVLLVGGGKFFVDAAVDIATGLGVSKAVIGLTIVAIGTSLPELATSLVAAFKKNVDIAVGNVVGSNIFNIFFILGISSLVAPLPKGGITDLDFYACIFASILLLLSAYTLRRYKITRLEGVIFVICYLAYIIYQVSTI